MQRTPFRHVEVIQNLPPGATNVFTVPVTELFPNLAGSSLHVNIRPDLHAPPQAVPKFQLSPLQSVASTTSSFTCVPPFEGALVCGALASSQCLGRLCRLAGALNAPGWVFYEVYDYTLDWDKLINGGSGSQFQIRSNGFSITNQAASASGFDFNLEAISCTDGTAATSHLALVPDTDYVVIAAPTGVALSSERGRDRPSLGLTAP